MSSTESGKAHRAPQVIFLVLGMLCTAYGVLVMTVNSGTLFFAVWFALAILFLLLAWTSRRRVLQRMGKKARRAGGVIVALAAVWLIVTQACIAQGFCQHAEDDLDYVVVLGAQVYDNGPSTVLRYRLDAARTYLEANPDATCIVTGAQGHNEPCPEAEVMSDYLIQHGIDEGRVVMEPQAKNTEENIAYSKGIIERTPGSVGVVTNNFHMYRALQLCRKQGLDAQGIVAPSDTAYLPNNLLRESLSLTKDFLVGNL